MEASQTINLYITYVEKEGPFLKVWGQTEKNNSIYVEQFLLGASPQFDLGVGKLLLENLQVGTLVCAKYKDNKYYRARITNISFVQEGFVEVSFLDYGNKDVVPCGNIRSLQNFPSSFISIPPLATGFIFAEAHCPGGGEWNETIFENISKDIKYREVQCTLLIQATQYFLIKIFIGGNDLCGMLISRGFMQPISLQAQQAVLLSMSMHRQSQALTQSVVPQSTVINTYKACTLEPGCQYPVYVSYVNDGPCHFSVQLKQSEEILVMLMNDINTITLRLLDDIPIPGTICLSRCQEDDNICRAVVTNEVDNQFKVFYVDFGNYEVVPLDALYQIPFKYVLPKVMAIRFSLAGVEKSTVTMEMQRAFKQFVDNRLLHMKVLPTPTRTAIPKCELWDPETKTSALDVVNRAAQHAYPEPISLNRGFSQLVKVSFVYGCNRFYVQLASKENELLKLMLDLQSSCQMNDTMDISSIKVGLPCCALFESDEQWYRSQVVEVLNDSVKVRYIDYGNEETVPISKLKMIDGEQLTVLRPQAIECCLNGYQNMSVDIQRDEILEQLILEGQFTMKVVEMTNKKALVELFDSSNYNVSSLLLDKLAAAKSQVSPMLVQAGNKIEHRKSFSHQNGPKDQNFRQDRKPGRDYKSYDRNDRTNDRNEKPWRQENKDYRSNDKHSNENVKERGSWRENNKGFSPNNERYNNRDKSRNRNEHQAKSNFVENTDSWDTPNATDKSPTNKNDWNTPANDPANSRPDNFGRGKGRFDGDKENWNSGGHRGGYKKKPDFRKDGSEVSSSGSEKSFHKGPRTSSRNERGDRPKFQKKFDKPRNAPFNNTSVTNDSWNVSAVTSTDAASVTANFLPYDVVGTEANVVISWFHNPGHFYCQLADLQDQFKNMMEEIQQFYKSRKPEMSVVGAPIVGLFPEDNVLYRARVLEVIGSQYKVYYVDFGNVSTISKVWPIEKKFMNLPAQAIICSLSEIGPPDGGWPDADTYSKYFDKDTFICRFVNRDEEKTYVNLFHGNDCIEQLLIRDGLAVSTESTIPDIEIPLLLGQQFRAVIKSINNLSDIIIVLQCGLALSCKMHNVETATETFEDTLKGLLEQTVIVYVDNVIDDRLEVTLYDTEGSKITVVSPDEGAYDTVEVLCPPLVLRSSIAGYVSHAEGSTVYIQPAEYADQIASLLDRMFESYDGEKQDLPIIPEEGLLYAVHSGDGNWYRGKVTSFDDEKASVSYVDYGNCEDVAFIELRELNDVFLEVCTLCVQVSVDVPGDNLIDKAVVACVIYGENGWEGTVELQIPGESSATESVDLERGEAQGMTVPEVAEEFHEPEIIQESVVEKEIPLAKPCTSADVVQDSSTESAAVKGIQVLASHVDSPNEFYLQLCESLDAISELQLKLQTQVLEMPILENPAAGVLCAAPYSGNQEWYRAEVLDADDDITTVRFVDYGNTDVIDNKTTQIKTLPPNLLSLAVYATRCSLKVKSSDEEWNSNALDMFEALATAETVTVEFIDQDEKTNYVELYSDGKNIKDILIKENLALPTEFNVESKPTCYVSHLNSPSEFWIQLENCVDELEWIAEQLSSSQVENFPELDDLTPGTLCAALFPDDEMWYRARILSNTVAGIELLFIDYGSSCMSSSLKQLPEELVVTPPLAQKCSLQKPDQIPYWTPQAVTRFNEISEDGKTIFTVRKITTGETSVVQLLIDGEDITSMLLPTTEDGYVKNVESLESFSIEKNGEILAETYKLEPMPGMTWTDGSKEKLEELTNQGTLFQIEFIPENMVRLYLDGNDIRPTLGAVKTVSLNLSKTNSNDDHSECESGNIDQNDEIVSKEVEITGDADSNKLLNEKEVKDEVIEVATDNIPIVDESHPEINDTGNDIDSAEGEKSLNADVPQASLLGRDENVAMKKQTANDISDKDQEPPSKDVSEQKVVDNISESHNIASLLNQEVEKALDKIDITKSDEDKEISDKTFNEAATPEKDSSLSHEETGKENSLDTELSCHTKDNITSLPDEEIENSLDKKNEKTSRPSSSCSGRIKHDDRIIPAAVSRPHTPVDDECRNICIPEGTEISKKQGLHEMTATLTEDASLLHKESNTNADETKQIKHDPILPAVISSPQPPVDNVGTEISEKQELDNPNETLSVKAATIEKDTPLPHKETGESISESIESSDSAHADIVSLLHQEIERALDNRNNEIIRIDKSEGTKERVADQASRPSSSCSGKIKHDDRILPATISRPQTPINDKSEKDCVAEGTEVKEDEPKSRPQSVGSGKISLDERIVPAVLSRPHSPLPTSDDGEFPKAK